MKDILVKAYPDWLKDRDILGAKFYSALKSVGELALSVSPAVGDSIDWYELTTGKAFFSGEDLSYSSRLFAGAGVILGSRQIYEGVSTVAERIIREFPELNSETQRIIQKLADTFDNAKIESAESINSRLRQYYSNPPFKQNTPVINRTTTADEEFVRFFSDNTAANGRWIVRKEEVAGMSPADIADHLSMPFIPNKVTDVHLPSGVNVI